jgi:hypothetical protein
LIENQQNKTDWNISNKCVGFNVDIGTRNQNIFYSFSVSQDNGLATSEVINTYLNMVNNATGRNVATQNVSLYNLYKQRSYKATVTCLGNAMIQPSMYFVLRNVPMFEGPYWITSVTHVITPNNFKTSFSGTRQRIAELPTNDSYLQSVRQKFLTQVRKTGNKETAQQAPATNVNQIQNSKLPDEIKRLMLEHPIEQPQTQPVLSNELVEAAARLMKTDAAGNTKGEPKKIQSNFSRLKNF